MPALIAPYGSRLVNLLVAPEEQDALKQRASALPSVQLTPRQVCDLELLATGALSPLERFMGEADYACVLREQRLADGRLFPLPVTLPLALPDATRLDDEIALRAPDNTLLATMTVQEVYRWEPEVAAQQLCGTRNPRHPLLAEMRRWPPTNVAGRLRLLAMPKHHDYSELRLGPAQARARLETLGVENVLAFPTRRVLHRPEEALLQGVLDEVGGALLLQALVGPSYAAEMDHFGRVRSYRALQAAGHLPRQTLLSLLPLASRLGGTREVLWQALIQRNYGANQLLIAPEEVVWELDGASGAGSVDADQAQVERLAAELGVRLIPWRQMVYLPDEARYVEQRAVPRGVRALSLSARQVRESYLNRGRRLPEWHTRPAVARILADAYPPRAGQGFCVWFTGLSGAGKSTTAEILTARLQELGRRVTLLDGDVVRTHLSRGLGYSKEDRDINIRRIDFVAAEIVRHGGIAICAAVSPYRAVRDEVRSMVGSGQFIEVYVDTPLSVCEARDVKGLYAKAQRGEIQGLTGVDDPYEPPLHPEVVLDTVAAAAEENALRVLAYLAEQGFVRPGADGRQ